MSPETPFPTDNKGKPPVKAVVSPSSLPVKPKAASAFPPVVPPVDPVTTILNRNTFYRDGYRLLLWIALGEIAVIVLLVLSIIGIVASHQPRDRYFATTTEGRLIPMVPLDEPYLDRAKVLTWASTAATQIMTFGFHDYRQRLSDAGAKYFTEEGWASFTKALERSRVIESIEGSQQVVTSALREAAVVIQEGVMNGTYTWVVQLPMVITYTSGSKTQTIPTMLTLRIVRVSTLKNPEGIGIQQWIAEQG